MRLGGAQHQRSFDFVFLHGNLTSRCPMAIILAIMQKIREQLLFEPGMETTNRRPLRQPAAFEATWEIRFGPENRFRVLYDIEEEVRVVKILAVGEKQRDRLFIGGEEVEL